MANEVEFEHQIGEMKWNIREITDLRRGGFLKIQYL